MSDETFGRIVGEQTDGRPLWKFCSLDVCNGHVSCQECWKAHADWLMGQRRRDSHGLEEMSEAIGSAETLVSQLYAARETLKAVAAGHSSAFRVLNAIALDLAALPSLSEMDRFHLKAIREVLESEEAR